MIADGKLRCVLPASGITILIVRSLLIVTGLSLLLSGIFVSVTRADVPVPPRMLDPLTSEEAWNVIRLATSNIERLIRDERHSEVVDQISLCGPALRLIARTPVPGLDQAQRDDQIARAFRSVNLIARDGMAGNAQGVAAVFKAFQATLKELAQGFSPQTLAAEIYHCVDHPETALVEAKGALCDKCQRPLHARRIPYSFVYVEPGRPTLVASVRGGSSIAKGKKTELTLALHTPDARAVPPAALMVTHTQRVHIIIADPGLTDYHLTHALPGAKEGEYTFSFTPALDAPYRLWAAAVPCATGLLEYAMADIRAAHQPAAPPVLTDSHRGATDGCQFQITFPSGSRSSPTAQAGRLQLLRLHVTDATGQPVTTLEPFMNAFAHITGFYADQQTVFQLHPLGGDVLSEVLRGGPTLDFKFFPPKSGAMKLFCTVRVAGKLVTVPFVVTATPPPH